MVVEMIVAAVVMWGLATALALGAKRPRRPLYVIRLRKFLRVPLLVISVVGVAGCVGIVLAVVFRVQSLWPLRAEFLWPPADDVAYMIPLILGLSAWFAIVFVAYRVANFSASREGFYFYGMLQSWDGVDAVIDDGRRLWIRGRLARRFNVRGDNIYLSRIWFAIPPDAEQHLTNIQSEANRLSSVD
jgi:hypothetical protein